MGGWRGRATSEGCQYARATICDEKEAAQEAKARGVVLLSGQEGTYGSAAELADCIICGFFGGVTQENVCFGVVAILLRTGRVTFVGSHFPWELYS